MTPSRRAAMKSSVDWHWNWWVAFILAGVMGLLSILGFWHLRKVAPEDELVAPPVELRRASA